MFFTILISRQTIWQGGAGAGPDKNDINSLGTSMGR